MMGTTTSYIKENGEGANTPFINFASKSPHPSVWNEIKSENVRAGRKY